MTDKTFNATEHLMDFKGREYLEVKWRLVWLRDKHPNAIIDTELVKQDDKLAIFRSRITIPDGGSATGWGSESPADFKDYIEKAETKANGRALAALGFGTQFTGNELDEGERIVDAPADRKSTRLSEATPKAEPLAPKPTAPATSSLPQTQWDIFHGQLIEWFDKLELPTKMREGFTRKHYQRYHTEELTIEQLGDAITRCEGEWHARQQKGAAK